MALNRVGDGIYRRCVDTFGAEIEDEYGGAESPWKWFEGNKLQIIDFPECCHLSLFTNGTLVKNLFRILHPSNNDEPGLVKILFHILYPFNNDCFESHPLHNSTKARRAFQTASKTWRFFQAPRSRPTLGIVHI